MGTWSKKIHHFDSIDSTMEEAKRYLLKHGPSEGETFVARSQTQGRGRQGRTWISQPDRGLWFTTTLTPKLPLESWPTFSLIVGLTLVQTLETLGVKYLQLKWPNDVWIENEKLAGILVEAASFPESLSQPNTLLVGIGLNIQQAPKLPDSEVQATSLNAHLPTPTLPAKKTLLELFLRALESSYQRWSNPQGFDDMLHAWKHYDALRGAQVKAETSSGMIQGTGRGINTKGHFLLEDHSGILHTIHAGEVLKLHL